MVTKSSGLRVHMVVFTRLKFVSLACSVFGGGGGGGGEMERLSRFLL